FAPTPEQAAAIAAPLGPLLLVAGAGTGKTTVMAQRILHVVRAGLARPDQVLGLTFTNKAALNLKEKVRAALGPDADVTVATYHSFGASLVSNHFLELGLDPGAELLDRAQAWQLLFSVFDEFRFERRSALVPNVILDAALTLASRAADYLVPVAAVAADCLFVARETPWKGTRDTALARLELCQVVEAYERRKRERHLLDYGDQVALAVRLLEEHPEVAAAERERHPVVLLDEYQDTNYAQRRLLQLLYPPGAAVTAVGDDMQSIYAFRGAHLFNILHFPDHFGGGARRELQTTFRFGEPLNTVANRIQAQVGDALPKALVPRPGAAPTAVECFLAADDREEAAAIADDVVARHARGEAAWGDHAVLCRKRRLIGPVRDALLERGVPVEVVGASGLLDRPEIVDLVAWIEVVADPSALVALLRLLRGPRYRLGLRDLAALARHGREIGGTVADSVDDLESVPDLSPAARARLADYRRERAELAELARRVPLLDLAETIVLHTGLWHAAGDQGRENVLRFLDLAARFRPIEGDPGLTAFVEYLQLLGESEEDVAEAHSPEADSVRVMTVHQAKGLEFPVVYVPGLAGRGSSRIFPDDRAHENALSNASALPWWLRADDEGIPAPSLATQKEINDAIRKRRRDEEWRLLYVACTRARRHLVCSAAHWYPGASQPQGPSEFYDFVAGLAAEGLVTERFRHEPATVDPDVAAKERNRVAAGAGRYAAAVASDPDQLRLDDVAVSPAATAPRRAVPSALSVTGLVTFARCPKQFFWSVVRPLPRRSSPAARMGTAVHRWIEQRSGRQLSLLEPSGPEGDFEAGAPPAGDSSTALKKSFLASPWADLDPERVEAPFVLAAGRHVVRGRVDAVYRREGRLELVDFKTGRAAAPGDRPAAVQLNLYGLAAVDTWGADPDRLRTTYCYLRPDEPPALMSADWDSEAVEAVRADLAATLDALATERFDPTPGRWCRGCDFLPACGAGQRHVQE
ncbi:MAG TPA: ATP-dependent DNA helicase, partial [Acidimicrobiales bacterium]|nr:ATP-dependent DNA helicase [Acidimicrobiales bacterium]